MTTAVTAAPVYDAASLRCQAGAPGDLVARSADMGWTTVLLDLFRCDAVGRTFESAATPDLRLSVVVAGELDLDVLGAGTWHRSRLRPGWAMLVPGGQTRRMAWTSRRPDARPEMLNLFIPPRLSREALGQYGPEVRQERHAAPDLLPFHDPVVAAVGSSLLSGMLGGAPDEYAGAAARWLAAHLACPRGVWQASDRSARLDVADANVARAIELMGAHLGKPLSLNDLAREAGISKFHFSRRFKARTGETPLGYLLGLRLDAGRRMLATTDEPVGVIAHACGYGRASHFGAAFARRYGETPTAYRRRVPRS